MKFLFVWLFQTSQAMMDWMLITKWKNKKKRGKQNEFTRCTQ